MTTLDGALCPTLSEGEPGGGVRGGKAIACLRLRKVPFLSLLAFARDFLASTPM